MILCYIDPGTGSMLFTIIIGVVGAAIYSLRAFIIRMKTTGGRKVVVDEQTVPFAVFTDSKRYWNIFEPICRVFEEKQQELLYLTMSPDDPALEKDYQYIRTEFIGEDNKAFARMNFLHADIVISTTPGLDVFQWKRSKYVKKYVHVLHMPNDVTTYRMFGLDFYDAVLLSGKYQEEQIRSLEAIRDLPAKDLEIVGIPYMDEMRKRLEAEQEKAQDPDGRTTVLLAPSWGESGILKKYGSRMIDALLATGSRVIIRPHPQSFTSEKEMIEDLMKRYPDSSDLEWHRDNDNFEVLRRSDILISDFSGVIFDFALVFDRPVLYADTTFDKDVYDCYILDEELWTFRILPEIGEQVTDENIDCIGDLITNCMTDEKYAEGRRKARNETWQYEGQGTERMTEYLLHLHEEISGGKADPEPEKAQEP